MLLVALIAGAWLSIGATTAAVCVLAARGDGRRPGAPLSGSAAAELAPAADADPLAA